MDELYTAERGGGAFLNDRRLRVAARRNLNDAVIATGIPHLGRGNHPQALRELHRVLRPGAGVCTVVFGPPQANPCLGILMSTALEHAGLPARDPFQPGSLMSLGRPGLATELFKQAGFRDVASQPLSAPFHWPSAQHYLDFIRSSASPIQQIVAQLGAAAAQTAWDEMARKLDRFTTGDGWIGPNELMLTSARR